MDGKWTFDYVNAEIWWVGDEYNTKEEAILAGMEYFGGESNFDVGQKESVGFCRIHANSILEQVAEDVYEEVGEVADDLFRYVKKDDIQTLEDALNEVFNNWIEEKGYKPDFFKIVNRETIRATE